MTGSRHELSREDWNRHTIRCALQRFHRCRRGSPDRHRRKRKDHFGQRPRTPAPYLPENRRFRTGWNPYSQPRQAASPKQAVKATPAIIAIVRLLSILIVILLEWHGGQIHNRKWPLDRRRWREGGADRFPKRLRPRHCLRHKDLRWAHRPSSTHGTIRRWSSLPTTVSTVLFVTRP